MTVAQPMKPAQLSFTVKRVFEAPIDVVWNAWTDPEKVKEWWGPEGFTAPVCRMDFREGGATLTSMKSPDFGEIFNTWSYSRIEPHKRIEFVMRFSDSDGNALDPAALPLPPGVPAEVPHVVTFEDLGGGRTEMTITESGYSSAEAAELSKGGQEQVVEKMVTSIAQAMRATPER
jgi:uncharacterized protein YndB with AHSA1/START domain